jgi:DNA polymerase V
VPAGFPSPAEDYIDRALYLNELLIENAVATFAVKIAGDSMNGAGILAGDIAIINRARLPINGSIILAIVSGEFTIKRLRIKDGRTILQAENPSYPDIDVTGYEAFEIWGVVSSIVRIL